eukprot:GHVU01129659.1.p1 GENE.GHVU01129659.1~~GHVU01129659.1.p1  ORF type:complete len:179 (-),score=21.89 GHVU01129659.1:344-880(-)
MEAGQGRQRWTHSGLQSLVLLTIIRILGCRVVCVELACVRTAAAAGRLLRERTQSANLRRLPASHIQLWRTIRPTSPPLPPPSLAPSSLLPPSWFPASEYDHEWTRTLALSSLARVSQSLVGLHPGGGGATVATTVAVHPTSQTPSLFVSETCVDGWRRHDRRAGSTMTSSLFVPAPN